MAHSQAPELAARSLVIFCQMHSLPLFYNLKTCPVSFKPHILTMPPALACFAWLGVNPCGSMTQSSLPRRAGMHHAKGQPTACRQHPKGQTAKRPGAVWYDLHIHKPFASHRKGTAAVVGLVQQWVLCTALCTRMAHTDRGVTEHEGGAKAGSHSSHTLRHLLAANSGEEVGKHCRRVPSMHQEQLNRGVPRQPSELADSEDGLLWHPRVAALVLF